MEAIAWVLGIGIAVYLLFSFPKKMLILLGVLAVVAAGIGVWIYIEDNRSRWQREAISLSVTYDLEQCSSDYPMRLQFHNGGRRTLLETRFMLRGFREGRSNPLYEQATYSTDHIIEPGETIILCWTLPVAGWDISEDTLQAHPPQTLEWRASVNSARFRY